MRIIKSFESYSREPVDNKKAEKMAREILPTFQKKRENGEKVTIFDFDKYTKENNIESSLADSIMHILVDLGFDFDIEDDDIDDEYLNFKVSKR